MTMPSASISSAKTVIHYVETQWLSIGITVETLMSTCIETGSCIYKNMLNRYLVVGFSGITPYMYTCSIFAALVPKCTMYFFY